MTRLRILLLPILTVGCFYVAGRMHEPLLEKRRMHYEEVDETLMEDTSPLIAFTTVALGGFRGVLADVLWVRVSSLQEEGRYFEIVQLSDWITKLEPRIDSVWAFHAWNMAYNISVILQSPEDRWRWVNHGIHLLRDQGLRYNPTSAQLYWELSWLYHHKVGAPFDVASPYYRRELARQMTLVLGGPAPDYAKLLGMPSSREALLAGEEMRILVEGLEQEQPGLLAEEAADLEARFQFLEGRAQEDPRAAALLDYLRARVLTRGYGLDLVAMQDLDRQYGPLDWRLPQTHALYWASRGMPFAEGFKRISLHRVIYQSLAELFREGTLRYDPSTGSYEVSPSWGVVEHALAAMEVARAERPDLGSMEDAEAYFLFSAMELYEEHGRTAEAEAMRVRLETEFPEAWESLSSPGS
jgi:hypothetical protein